jgi:hypothetical protein
MDSIAIKFLVANLVAKFGVKSSLLVSRFQHFQLLGLAPIALSNLDPSLSKPSWHEVVPKRPAALA